jgi:uncharacterized protein YdeI (YjbR/CyaY-like superfamily)
MPKRSPEVDAYIAKAAPFAQPILEKIREAFHAASPKIEETMKWSVPHFEYKGIVGSMAAFKQHVGWGFWKARLMKDPAGILNGTGMGGARVENVKDLPPKKVLVEYVREAVQLNEEGKKVEGTRSMRRPAKPAEVPDDLAAALAKNKKARATFDQFSPSHRKEYIEWIAEAKQEATRSKRLAQAIEWMAEGKARHWKYMK